jgi:hypothetical protein
MSRPRRFAVLLFPGFPMMAFSAVIEPLRYEHPRPGDMIHLDTKKLGRINGIGHRITGDRSRRQRGIGWDYLHVAIDDCSRLAYTELRCSPPRPEKPAPAFWPAPPPGSPTTAPDHAG